MFLNLFFVFYGSFFLNLCCNFIGLCFYPPFWRPKGCKSSASEYNASLLVDCKRAQPTLFKRHSTDKIIAFGELRLRSLPVILTVLYLREVTFVKRALPLM